MREASQQYAGLTRRREPNNAHTNRNAHNRAKTLAPQAFGALRVRDLCALCALHLAERERLKRRRTFAKRAVLRY